MPKEDRTIMPSGNRLSPKEYQDWQKRLEFASKYHINEIKNKYKRAKRRYNSEIRIGAQFNPKTPIHDSVNMLINTCKNFIGSIFFRNPEVDLSARSDDEQERRNVENLEQAVNDDVKDDRELKRTVRSMMVDEYLASVGAVYIDYSYKAEDMYNGDEPEYIDPMQQQLGIKQEVYEDEVKVYKIKPENIIRPPYQDFYSYKSAPYLGYVDIRSLDDLMNDESLDQSVVAKCKGKKYKELVDKELEDEKEDAQEGEDENTKYVKTFCVFIKDPKTGFLKRLVIACGEQTEYKPLAYGDWRKGHGKDGKGYPIHIWAADEPCEGFLAPSQAYILENISVIIDYLFNKLNRHLRRSGTRTYMQTGKDGVAKAELLKALKSQDLEIIGIQGMQPGQPINNSILQIVDQALGADHMDMFMLCKQIYAELSRQPSFAKSEIINKDKTATETQAIQMADESSNGDYIDKFKDWWTDVLIDWAKLLQNNMELPRNMTVRNKETGEDEPREGISRDDMQGEFNVDINVESFLPPNKNQKRMIAQETLQAMVAMSPEIRKSGYDTNMKKLVDSWAENIDMRDSEDLLIKRPVRDPLQQVMDFAIKKIPFNPEELSGDTAENLQKLIEIHADLQLMATLEQINPETSNELEKFTLFLGEQMMPQKGQKPPKPSMAPDMKSEAGLMGQSAEVIEG